MQRALFTKAALRRKLELSMAETNPEYKTSLIMGKESQFRLVPYNPPSSTPDMAVILTFYNPANSVRIFQNLLTVKTQLDRANIPVFIGEVAHVSQRFCLPPANNVFQFQTESYMFYKENLTNVVEKRIPDTFNKILLLDADIVFEDAEWYDKVSRDLDRFECIQPFASAHYLNPNFTVATSKDSFLRNDREGHQGFAVAFQRKWLKMHGLYDYAVVGSGDTHLMYALKGRDPAITHRNRAYVDWCNSSSAQTLSHSFCDLTIYHLPHGLTKNRQYKTRMETIETVLERIKANCMSDLTVRNTENGMLDWKPDIREEVNKLMLTYFRSRMDDGTDDDYGSPPISIKSESR